MTHNDGLICAYLLDGKGGGRSLNWDGVRAWSPNDGVLWVHLDRVVEENQRWLRQEADLDNLTCDALLAEETRPRCVVMGDGLMAILRGVNLNPGAEPDDMVSIRLWVDANRIISLRQRRLLAIQDIADVVQAGKGPTGSADFLTRLVGRISERLTPVLANLDELIDGLEEQVVESQNYQLRMQLGVIRRQAIMLRRYIGPQREAITRLQSESPPWLGDDCRARLREIGDRITRCLEDLDALRERAAVVQEELASRLSEQMNKNMYLMSIVAAIFLPLGLLTGLLGINVGGIPGTDSSWSFAIVCVLLVVVAAFQLVLFRRFRLM